MRLLAVATTAVLIALLSTATGPAAAKCTDPAFDVRWPQPDADHTYPEAEWGDAVQLVGYCWVTWSGEELVWKGEQFEVFARFSLAMPDGEGTDLPPAPSLHITGDAGFDELFILEDVFGRPGEPQPGWVEFVARSDDVEARRSIVITAGGRRPADAGFVSGQVHNMPPPPYGIYAVWARVDDPDNYRFTIVSSDGAFRTDYLSEGEWFIGIYDINEELHAVDPDVVPVTGHSTELGRDVVLMGRTVNVAPSEPLQGVDFTLSDASAPASGATQLEAAPDKAQTSRAAPVEAEDDAPAPPATQFEAEASSAAGWLAPALLSAVGGLLVAGIASARWAVRRRG